MSIQLTFYRQSFSVVTFNLLFGESLAISPSSRFRAWDGTSGQLTFWYVPTNASINRTPIEVVPGATPGVDRDEYEVAFSLASLPDGDYEIRGSVVDPLGNVTVLSSSLSYPPGTPGVTFLPVSFKLVSGSPFALHTIRIPPEFRTVKVPADNRTILVTA